MTTAQDERRSDGATGRRRDAGATAGATGLAVTDLYKEYPTPAEPLVVLRGVTLALSPGEAVAVVGPSGSGKSTLLNILGTLDSPTRGRVLLDGVDPFSLSPNELARFRGGRVGFIFQDHHLLPQCTALENVLIARLAVGAVTKDDSARGAELLRLVGLEGRATHRPAELSGGERQRVAIARALMNKPSLLLCDEPTGNLDMKTSASVGELLHSVTGAAGAMMVVVTHSPDLARSFPRQLRMADGQLVNGA
jgi:lipoprotein-releasing system ATP-binding protein